MKEKIIILLALFLIPTIMYGQHTYEKQFMTSRSRITKPVEMKVVKINNKVVFSAINRSYYPFQLTIKFSNLYNLSPVMPEKSVEIVNGLNSGLITFYIIEQEKPHGYKYNIKYSLGRPGVINKEFLYLSPIGKSKKINLYTKGYEKSKIDRFNVMVLDTVYCMRRGMIVAVPDMPDNMERISKSNSIEILHDDGSVMIYYNIDFKMLVKPGKLVYPGQPIGIINSQGLEVSLVSIVENPNIGPRSLIQADILYYINDNVTGSLSVDFNGLTQYYSEEIIIKELTKREKNKYRKRKLY